MARKDLFHRRDHTGGVLFATRGCPHRCDFCTLAVMYQSRVRKRRVEAVAEEYGSFPGKVIILWDDNIASDIEYAKTLFRALAPHRKWWSSQASIHAARNDEFLELAARSGCKQLFVGLESISQASLNEVQKRFNRVTDYARAIERIHSHGIAVQAGIVFGFDNDERAIFGETLDFLEADRSAECDVQHPDSLSRDSAVPTSGGRGPDSDPRLEQVQRPGRRCLPAQTDEPGGTFGGIPVCEQALLLLAKRMQTLVALSGRTVLDSAPELGVRVRFFC